MDTAVLADNDVTVDPPAAKRRKGPKRHDEAWDPAEDSSGEEQPEAWKSHAEDGPSDDEVAERLWRRVEEEATGPAAAEMLIEEEEDWDPEATVEQAAFWKRQPNMERV